MIKILFKLLKIIVLFMFFWFLNNGFLIDPIWQPLQAGFFTVITLVMLKYTKLKLIHWISLIILLYVISAILEAFKIQVFPDIVASTGFGVLVITVIIHMLKNIKFQTD